MRDLEPSMRSNTMSNEHAWLIVFSAMGLAGVGRMTRADAEWLLDSYFDRIDDVAGQMFPETKGAQ